MIDRIHIRIGSPSVILGRFDGPNGFLRNADGRKTDVSRIDIGWQLGNDKLVPYTLTENDTSTGPTTVTVDTGDVIVADNEVTRTVTIRDMTAPEILARNNVLASEEANQILGEIQRRTMNLLFSLAKVNDPALTLQNFVISFEGSLGDTPITRQMFIDYIRDNRL